MNKELKGKIQNFIKADYPRVGKHISLIECLKTITKDSIFKLESWKAYIINRMFKNNYKRLYL